MWRFEAQIFRLLAEYAHSRRVSRDFDKKQSLFSPLAKNRPHLKRMGFGTRRDCVEPTEGLMSAHKDRDFDVTTERTSG
jgi:hypothetical protein